MNKPNVAIRDGALVYVMDGQPVLSGVIGVGHPHLGEGTFIRSSIVKRITNNEDGTSVVETMNTNYVVSKDNLEISPLLCVNENGTVSFRQGQEILT